MKRCTKCVTPESYPRSDIGSDGVCNFCTEYETRYRNWHASKADRQAKFQKLIDKAKRKRRKYDVLVPLSGGKDSSYVLYLATKVYQCRTLAFNYDNGFQSDIARKNIQSAVNRSGADLVVFKPNEAVQTQLYRHFMDHTGLFCPVCMRGVNAGQFTISQQFKVPLMLKGTSKRTEENVVPEIFQAGYISFFRNVLRRHPYQGSGNIDYYFTDRRLRDKIYRALYILSNGRLTFGTLDVQVPDYLDWDYRHIRDTIKSELGWETLPDRDEHVDCLADPTGHYLRKLRYNDLTPNTLRYSAEIRSGQMQRDEALACVENELQDGISDRNLQYFLDKLQMSHDELLASLKEPLRHMDYQKDDLLVASFKKARQMTGANDIT